MERADDFPGWDRARWGMTGAQLDALFGPRLHRIDPPLAYHDATVGRMLPQMEFAGQTYRVLFQMDAADRLQQVLLERRDGQATPGALATAQAELEGRYGAPALACGRRLARSETSPSQRERVWIRPTTTVHLTWLDHRSGLLTRDPQQDIDPLVSELETRLYARRSLPRRLLVRFHPTEREDLMGAGCRPAAG